MNHPCRGRRAGILRPCVRSIWSHSFCHPKPDSAKDLAWNDQCQRLCEPLGIRPGDSRSLYRPQDHYKLCILSHVSRSFFLAAAIVYADAGGLRAVVRAGLTAIRFAIPNHTFTRRHLAITGQAGAFHGSIRRSSSGDRWRCLSHHHVDHLTRAQRHKGTYAQRHCSRGILLGQGVC